MNATAVQLPLGLKEPRKKFDETHVAELLRRLKAGATPENRGWLTSTELGARTWSEKRDLRSIRALAKGRVISWPGSPGYKPADACTLEEIAHYRRAIRSQVREMLTNLRQGERLAHAALAGAKT